MVRVMDKGCVKISKYNSITFWKILFTFAIVIFHYAKNYKDFEETYSINMGWRIAVEFFFIVSGFLLAHKCRKSEMNALRYTLHRYIRLFPEYFISLLIMTVIRIYNDRYTLKMTLIYLLNMTDDILMLNAAAISYVNINGALWYLSAMLISGYFIYWFYRKNSEFFVQVTAPASCIAIYSSLSIT